MRSADIVWGGLLVVGAAVEVHALFNERAGDTLSERVRAWFRVRTRRGRLVFAGSWVGFAVWFLFHILRG